MLKDKSIGPLRKKRSGGEGDRRQWLSSALSFKNSLTSMPRFAAFCQNVNENVQLSKTGVVTPNGIMQLFLRDKLIVEITVDEAVRVLNRKCNTVSALSETGSASALLHPNGRVYQCGSRVEVVAHDFLHGNHKFAKMWNKGVSFTSEECALVYLLDTAGTRTTTDTFSDMTQDFSLGVFYATSRHGPECIPEAINILKNLKYCITQDGTENWIFNNLRIIQSAEGLLSVTLAHNCMLKASPSSGAAALSTPFVHATASLGTTPHLFVRSGERRMYYNGSSFIVRNAGHSAGFDDKNFLKIY